MLGDLNIAEPRRAHRLCGTARHRADDRAEAARRLPAQRVPARARHARRGGRSPRAEGDASRARCGSARRLARRRAAPCRPRMPGSAEPDGAVPLNARGLHRMDPLDRLLALETPRHQGRPREHPRACEALGHPERAYRSVIVAGTNGKGSVTAMVEAALRRGRPSHGRTPRRIWSISRNGSSSMAGPSTGASWPPRRAEVLDVDGGVCAADRAAASRRRSSRSRRRWRSSCFAARGWRLPCSRSAWAAASTRPTSSTPRRRDHVDRARSRAFLGDTLEASRSRRRASSSPACRSSWAPPGDALARRRSESRPSGGAVVVADEDVAADVAMEDGETWLHADDAAARVRARCARAARTPPGRQCGGRGAAARSDRRRRLRVPPAAVEPVCADTEWRGRLEWIDRRIARGCSSMRAQPGRRRARSRRTSASVHPPGAHRVRRHARQGHGRHAAALLPHATRLILTRSAMPRARRSGVACGAGRGAGAGAPLDDHAGRRRGARAGAAADSGVCVAGSIFVLGEVHGLRRVRRRHAVEGAAGSCYSATTFLLPIACLRAVRPFIMLRIPSLSSRALAAGVSPRPRRRSRA